MQKLHISAKPLKYSFNISINFEDIAKYLHKWIILSIEQSDP